MRLIDQTNIQRFFLLMYGPQPVAAQGTPDGDEARATLATDPRTALVNEQWFPRVKALPPEVEGPRSFPKSFGLIAALSVAPDTGNVLGSLLPVQDEIAMSRRLRPLWCVWDREGRLLHAFEALDAVWTEHGLLTLAWSDNDESSDYVLELRGPETFESLQNARFVVPANADRTSDQWLSAEAFGALGSAAYWAVWLADGQGASAFDVHHVTGDRILRVYTRGMPAATEDTQPYAPVLRKDEQVLAYATWTKRDGKQVNAVGLVALRTGAEQVHPVLGEGEANVLEVTPELELRFEPSGKLHVATGPWSGTFDVESTAGEPWQLTRTDSSGSRATS